MPDVAPQPDRVSSSFGVIHVMPEAYREGKPAVGRPEQSEGSLRGQNVPPKTPPLPPKPAPKVVPPKVAPPRHHRPWVLFVALGVVVLSIVAAALIILLSPKPSEPPPAPVVTTPTPAPVTPTSTPVTPAVPSPEPPKPFEGEPRAGKDTDSDGLSDVEEELFGGQPRLPDSDGDGFLDGNEVFHAYAPSVPAPTTLEDLGLVESVSDRSVYPLTFLLPKSWSLETDPASGVLTLEASKTESFTFTILPKSSAEQSLAAWLAAGEDTKAIATTVQFGKTKRAEFPLATVRNQRTAYVDMGDVVLAAAYTLTGKETVEYLQTFQMILGSLEKEAL